MREKTIKLYQFDELDEKGQEKALQWWSRNYDYPWSYDAVDSLKKFCKILHTELKDWEIDYQNGAGRSNIKIKVDENLDSLRGIRLWKWINNNFPKYVESCPFTGCCFDEDLLTELRKFMKKPGPDTSLDDLIRWGFDDLCNALADDFNYQCYGEGAKENIKCNEYEFLEDGSHA